MTPPNIVIVVLDCVRAWDFPGGPEAVRDMSFVEELRKESVQYPRTAAVAPWTLPSHASLFTGLYPWEHGNHARRSLALDPGVPRLPDLLRSGGYRSISLSANGLVSPPTGLTLGFDSANWGSQIGLFLRTERGLEAPYAAPNHQNSARTGDRLRRIILQRIPYDELPIRPEFERHVAWSAVAARVSARLSGRSETEAYVVGRWVEPAFDRFIAGTPTEQPVFSFVNLLDAHEPYFPDPETVRMHGGWWKFAQLRQDRTMWFRRKPGDPSWDTEFLHELYRSTIRGIDGRLRTLVESLKRHGRWDNTLLVVTSDHGQAFGENGMLYHRFRVDDAQIRIPLLVRYPQGEHGGTTARGWASLVDVAPTCLETAGLPVPPSFPGRPLVQLLDESRPEPIFAVSDGTIGEHWIPKEALPKLDRVSVAAYSGDTKVVAELSPEQYHVFDLSHDFREATDLVSQKAPEWNGLFQESRTIGLRLEENPRIAPAGEVAERLESWGYV